jgi:kynureninase
MPREFSPTLGAQSFQHSNPPLLSLLPLFSSLEVFALAGVLNDNKGSPMSPLVHRSRLLTGYLEKLLRQSKWMRKAGENGEGVGFSILTGKEGERGAQLSLDVRGRRGEEGGMKRVFGGLVERGVMGDEREPNVIRLAYVPISCFLHVIVVTSYPVDLKLMGILLSRTSPPSHPTPLLHVSSAYRRSSRCPLSTNTLFIPLS